jgi:Zn-dependent M28 family amino/carboxypeptidase
VILLSHYDTKPGVKCPGANDGASTSGLLVGIVNAITDRRDFKGNLLLVWTDGEECMDNYGKNDGLWGARRAVEYVKSKNMEVQAVVCLDMLGDKDLEIKVPANGSPTLSKIAVHAARRAGYPGLVSLWDQNVTDDFAPFLENGFNAIGMIDFSYGPGNSYWHTEADAMDKISVESLLKSGKVVAEMLNILL